MPEVLQNRSVSQFIFSLSLSSLVSIRILILIDIHDDIVLKDEIKTCLHLLAVCLVPV